ncbi:TIGR04222 domain-containing protein [Lentzea albidocapillata subsp. violacea]|uniref:TIGR04222 domain-containing protein n=1 Tax=Lentzea albidocapillata subsp. violacea TaxID=128104 RepID=A0A1G9V7V0_9PSEU|nr:TIGR04222 domain-containing membrane protein [Lentzea albidocapillata]SDM68241.1 TIGR04222 domain-containing protein [Lentzea albidocapillata subsp. violacea]
MPRPWGLSGPEFLQLYWIGLALAVLVAIVVRVRVRAGHSTQPVRSLDMDELAYLAGGPRRVVETAVARLLTAGELRPSRRGTVQATSTMQSLNPVDRAVVTDCQRYTNRTVNLMIPAVAEDGVVTAIGQRLEAMGLVVNPAVAKSALRKGSIALWVLIVIGLARWVNGIAIGANIGWLTVQLVLTGLLILTLRLTRRGGHIRTRKGDRVLDDARRTSTRAAGSVDEVVYAGAAGAVLFGGLVVYPDLAVRTSLLASSGSGSYSSSGSACSAGSSSCSSGSSCGGGGGGCGGGGG